MIFQFGNKKQLCTIVISVVVFYFFENLIGLEIQVVASGECVCNHNLKNSNKKQLIISFLHMIVHLSLCFALTALFIAFSCDLYKFRLL